MLGRVAFLAFVAFATAASIDAGRQTSGARATVNVDVRTLPANVYTVVEGVDRPLEERAASAHADPQNLTWLFHLVLTSREREPLRIERVRARFSRGGVTQWEEAFSRPYLERMEWTQGAFDMTPEYYLTKVLHGAEQPGTPDIPAGGTVSWVRVAFARPWFGRVDNIALQFDLVAPSQRTVTLDHTVPVVHYQQKTPLRLPFGGTWAVNVGNDLSTGHRRSGLNGLTSVGWDFVKLGPDAMPFRRDGKTPQDFYTYGEPVLAAAAGTVVDVRNDIREYGIGEAPSGDQLRADGDVFSGNLVTVDVGNGEYTFTCHMLMGSVPVRKGDRVQVGQVIGRVGMSGYAGVPHIHFNLISGPKWLDARGLPALFSGFERIRTGGAPQRIDRGNPVTDWLIRNREDSWPSR
jgi:hypothetical protein